MSKSLQKHPGHANADIPTVLPIVGERNVTILDRFDSLSLEQGKLAALLDMLDQALCSDEPPDTLHSYVCVMREQCQRAEAAASRLWGTFKEGNSNE